jgi:enterochelin esterase family protein
MDVSAAGIDRHRGTPADVPSRRLSMKRFVYFVLLAVIATSAFAASSLTYTDFYSNALQGQRLIGVYLPDGYPGGGSGYPVIYKLHAWGGNHVQDWSWLKPLLDTLIETGQMQPVIVVTPNGLAGQFGGSLWTNSLLYGPFEDYVAQDMVTHMDTTYQTIPIARKRALLGFSMGAIGSMTIGLSHPDVFGAVAAHSGYFNWDRVREEMRDRVLGENTGPPYNYNPNAGTYTRATFMVAGGYSPNLSNPPYNVDYPFDVQGDVVEAVLDRWKAHNPAVLAAALPPGAWPDLYFDCGDMDEFFSYPTNLDLAAALDSMEVPYEFRPYNGNHSLTAEKIQFSLAFLDRVIGSPAGAGDPTQSAVGQIRLHPGQPNPVNDETVIRFEATARARTTLKVFDVHGRLVETLLDGVSSDGRSAIRWQSGNVPAGTYFIELRSGEVREARKLIVTR